MYVTRHMSNEQANDSLKSSGFGRKRGFLEGKKIPERLHDVTRYRKLFEVNGSSDKTKMNKIL